MDITEALESPAFWILGAGGVTAEVIGYIASKKMELVAMPFWQFLILVIVTLLAAAFFATRD